MNKLLRYSVAAGLGFMGVAAGCGGDEKPSGGLSTTSSGSGGSKSSGGSSSTVVVDSGDGDNFVPGPPVDDSGTGNTSGYGSGNCAVLEGLGECGTTTVEAQLSPANILLVIDKSGSMADQPEGFTVDKWGALKAALDTAFQAVTTDINFGLALYPFAVDREIALQCESGCCEVPTGAAAINVPIEGGTTAVPKILDALDQTAPGGGTPTAAALGAALEYYTTGSGAALVGDKYVLLATDGGPNCVATNVCDGASCTSNLDGQCMISNCCMGVGELCLDDQGVIDQINALKDAGIRTFVVGIPGTEQYASYLDTFATAGGVPNPNGPPQYYAVSAQGGVDALAATFTDITTHLVRSCEVDLSEEPANKDLVNVAIDCEVVPFGDGANWDIPADTPTTLMLYGDPCNWVETHGARRLDVVYGCPTLR